jgi:hypothetical protein
MPGRSTCPASSVGCRDVDAGPPDLLRLTAVAVVERLLAADAAKHAKACGGVGPERGELPDLLALRALTRLERPDDAREREHEDGHADQHDEPEDDGAGQEDHRDDDVRDGGPREARGDVEGAAGAERVVRHRRDHLAGRQPTTDGGPGARCVVAHDLDQAERRHQPVLHGVAVAHDAREPLDDPERQQDERPEGERMPVVVDDPVLDGASDRERHQRLGEHPGDPERDPDRERADLAATDPDEEALRRPGVGDARVDQRKVAHPEGRVRSRPFAHGRTRGL